MIGKTAVLVATCDRKQIVARALPSLTPAINAAGVEADIWIYDDGSEEYDAEWLHSLVPGARVIMLPKQDPNPHRSISKLRSSAFRDALDFADYEYFLHSDGDMLYDPDAFGQIARIMDDCTDWDAISLFNPSLWDWEARSSVSGADWYQYKSCGGTMFLRLPEPKKHGFVKVPWDRTWDNHYSKVFGRKRVCISRTSYVEHLGSGIHRENPARNPTAYLRGILD